MNEQLADVDADQRRAADPRRDRVRRRVACGRPDTRRRRNSRFEAQRAATLLTARAWFEVEVCGLVAIMGVERGFTVVEQPGGVVTIVTRKQVAAHLASLPTVLGTPSIDRLYAAARHLATWQPTTVGWSSEF